MRGDTKTHISLTQVSELVSFIREACEIDLSPLSTANLKFLVSNFLHDKNIRDVENLQETLAVNSNSLNEFLSYIEAPETEMFRDPKIWIFLRDDFLPHLLKERNHIRAWFPLCSSGDDLSSFNILITEGGLANHTEIHASSFSLSKDEELRKMIVPKPKYSISLKNHLESGGITPFESYFQALENTYSRKQVLFSNALFTQSSVLPEDKVNSFDLIFFRNKLIYYKPEYHDEILKNLISGLRKGSILILGYKETIRNKSLSSQLEQVCEDEKVFRKL